MTIRELNWRSGWLRDVSPRACRSTTLFLAVAAVAFGMAEFGANAAEDTADAVAVEAQTQGGSDATVPRDYRLAPGDRLTLVVYDQPQLSGEFIVDGGGDILLPVAGGVTLSGLTLAQAQKLIQERFADGVLVQPSVSLRIKEHRSIFVTGQVKKPGNYPYIFGLSVKAAIASAGGEGQSLEQPFNTAASDFITAQQHVRQLESDQTILLMRKARLEAQRDARENFVIPLLVGFNRRNVDFDRAYAAENDTFLRMADSYSRQAIMLQEQRPRIQEEVDAVNAQIANQRERLEIVTDRLTDLDGLFGKGLLRKEVLINQQIEKSLVEAQLSNLQAQVARLRQNMGDLDLKLEELKASHERQTLTELQDASQRLAEIENSIGPARKLLELKSEAVDSESEESNYKIMISHVRDGRLITSEATAETMLSPGDVVEVKRKRRDPGALPSILNQAAQTPEPASFVTGASVTP
jgi:polysaccharide export outer membrane protein